MQNPQISEVKDILESTDKDNIKKVISFYESKLDDAYRRELEERMRETLKKKYAEHSEIVKLANNFEIISYKTHRNHLGIYKCEYIISLCKAEECDSKCSHLIIHGVMTSFLIYTKKIYTSVVDYYIAKESVETPIRKLLQHPGTTHIYHSAVSDIMKELVYIDSEVYALTFSFFGLVPTTENKLRTFLKDLLDMVTVYE